jgi:hypothetical protein
MLVVRALKISQLTDGGMPPPYDSMHNLNLTVTRVKERRQTEVGSGIVRSLGFGVWVKVLDGLVEASRKGTRRYAKAWI